MNAAKRDSTVADDALVYTVLAALARAPPHSTRFAGYLSRQGNSTTTAAPSRRPSCLVVFAWGFSGPPPRKGPVMMWWTAPAPATRSH